MSDPSPNEQPSETKMRSDLSRIAALIHDHNISLENGWYEDANAELQEENNIWREIVTSWQAVTAADYQTDARFHLNMLTKRMLNGE